MFVNSFYLIKKQKIMCVFKLSRDGFSRHVHVYSICFFSSMEQNSKTNQYFNKRQKTFFLHSGHLLFIKLDIC